jgi:hypothetical protein
MDLLAKTVDGTVVRLSLSLEENNYIITKIEPVVLKVCMKNASLEDILDEVCSRMDISAEAIKGKCREREVVEARFIFFKRAKELTNYSQRVIGSLVGKGHCDVFYGIKQTDTVPTLIKLYAKYYGHIEDLNTIKDPIPEEPVPSGGIKKVTCELEKSFSEAPVKRVRTEGFGYRPFMGYVPHHSY